MSAPNLHLLVIGLGSAGKRHARNLRALGCTVSGFDPRADRQQEAAAEGPLASTFGNLEEALKTTAFDGFVIASPPAFHIDQIIAAGAGFHKRNRAHIGVHRLTAWVETLKVAASRNQRRFSIFIKAAI